MKNSDAYTSWREALDLTGLPTPDADGYFRRASQRCLLPFFRAYWKGDEPPEWQPATWRPLADGFIRYLRADQALDFVAHYHPPKTELQRFSGAVRRAMKHGWLTPVDQHLLRWEKLLARRVEAIHIKEADPKTGKRTLRWSRKVSWFPQLMRYGAFEGELTQQALAAGERGLDLVHTPESERAGLSSYLCEGWEISDDGSLTPGPAAADWGPSTAMIPACFSNAPRRLMLGAALQAKAVRLEVAEHPHDVPDEVAGCPPGRNLKVTFSVGEGFTHEDAVVVSESAARKLSRPASEEYDIRLLVPSVASSVWWVEPGPAAKDSPLARAWIDLFALGWRGHKLSGARSGKGGRARCPEDGWLEIALPGGKADADLLVMNVEHKNLVHAFWRTELTLRVRRDFGLPRPLEVGDKVATRHGIKGVVSRIVPDADMPLGAEILLSPDGVLRRQAMGQFREAAGGNSPAELTQSGTAFVLRQPQDAVNACRVRGRVPSGMRGQRYGWMEFAALLSHGAPAVARELLSASRSSAGWIGWEAQCRDLDDRLATWAAHADALHAVDPRQLARQALNRYLSLVGAGLQGRKLVFPQVLKREIVVAPPTDAFWVPLNRVTEAKLVLENLSEPQWWRERRGNVALDLRESPVTVRLNRGRDDDTEDLRVEAESDGLSSGLPVEGPFHARYQAFPLLPPWLRPADAKGQNELTRLYERLLYSIQDQQSWEERGERLIARCIRATFGRRYGAESFVLREVLGRRLNRSARAVIVPDPTLRIDEIRLPQFVADELFEGLLPDQRRRVLVHRNPTLHRRSLLALKPIIDESDIPVFGLPLGVLSNMGADFDGDQVCVVAIETEEAISEAELMAPGSRDDLRRDPFRQGTCPAFPLLHELRVPDEELEIASACVQDIGARDWCRQFEAMTRKRIDALRRDADGWSAPQRNLRNVKELDELDARKGGTAHRVDLYLGRLGSDAETRQEWFNWARKEMMKIYGTVRAKGRLGGVLRRQLFQLKYRPTDPEGFRKAVEAYQAVTERLTQSALSAKTTKGAIRFSETQFFETRPVGYEQALLDLDDRFDVVAVCAAIGEQEKPTGLLAWLAKPTLETLMELMLDPNRNTPPCDEDPRVNWYL